MNWARLQARAGELIRPKWRELLRWARSMKFKPGPGILWRQTPDGVLVWAKPAKRKRTPFGVSITTDGFRVGPGTLDGGVPVIDGVTLDGRDESGAPVARPLLPFGAEPENQISWVVLLGSDEALAPGTIAVADEPGTGQDLAMIRWANGKPDRVFQIARHNYNSGLPAAAGESAKRSRLYWPV
jgi:hypothetical protein